MPVMSGSIPSPAHRVSFGVREIVVLLAALGKHVFALKQRISTYDRIGV